MPLFKSKKKAQAQPAEQQSRDDFNRHQNGGAAGAGRDPAVNDYGDPNVSGHVRAVNGHGPNAGGPGPTGSPVYNDSHDLDYGQGGYGGQAGYGQNRSIPPAGAVNQGAGKHRGLDRLEGRAEQRVGELVGSRNLQAKGAQKEQEANTIKAQSAELAEAERLEREAAMHRERAVAHGAHPANKELGAGRMQNNN